MELFFYHSCITKSTICCIFELKIRESFQVLYEEKHHKWFTMFSQSNHAKTVTNAKAIVAAAALFNDFVTEILVLLEALILLI